MNDVTNAINEYLKSVLTDAQFAEYEQVRSAACQKRNNDLTAYRYWAYIGRPSASARYPVMVKKHLAWLTENGYADENGKRIGPPIRWVDSL